MCFSPEGDLVGGLVITAIGVDACLHLRGRPEYRLIAPFPILLGLHQLDETFVWWQLQGHVSHDIGVVAMWIYLLFAFVVLPTLVPTMVLLLEPQGRPREGEAAPDPRGRGPVGDRAQRTLPGRHGHGGRPRHADRLGAPSRRRGFAGRGH